MHNFWELPLLINDTSKQKYACYTIYQINKPKILNSKYIKTRKENKNPFRCLNRIPQNTNLLTTKHLKPMNQINMDFNSSASFYEFTNSKMNTLPPLVAVTAPKGIALKAYEQIHLFIKQYIKYLSNEETLKVQINLLKEVCGSISQINRRITELIKNGFVILDPILNIIFHSLQAEVSLKEEKMEKAIDHFKRVEYYCLKMSQNLFAIYCMIEQSDIFKSETELERGIACLSNALALSIVIESRDTSLVVLEKIGMLYYYSGNTAMGEQFHKLAERGLTTKEEDIFKNQFSLDNRIKILQAELFSIVPNKKPKTKKFTRYEQEINSDLQEESILEHSIIDRVMVSQMLKDNAEKRTGTKLKAHIKSTLSLARIIPHSLSPPKEDNTNQHLPFFNVSQVLKSHLSRNRGGVRGNRQWQIKTLLQMIETFSHLI